MSDRFWGSMAALVIGGLSIVAGISQAGSGAPNSLDTAIGGSVMVLGALAYRSLKRRRLGIKSDSTVRRGMEIVIIAAALCLVVLQRGFLDRLYLNPVVSLLIPAWVLIAYAVVFFKRPR